MLIQDTILYRPDWKWHNFLKYLINSLSEYNCLEKKIPSEYSYKDSHFFWIFSNHKLSLYESIQGVIFFLDSYIYLNY